MSKDGEPPSSVRARATPDLFGIVVLVVIPLLLFGIPAVTGHLQLTGDNLAQNFPLRVLVGRQLRGGHLPVLNPYIWGGAPLLGGWNAGALYPTTALFAVLPATGAWALNVMGVYWVAGLGLYALLRTLGLRPVPSLLGAGTFAYGGAMQVHLVHFGLVAGMSWIPVILLAELQLTRATTWRARSPWMAVLAAAGGLCVLAGEPRAIDTTIVVAVVFFIWLLARERSARPAFGLAVGGATAIAVLIGAVQWLPGTLAVSTSQRAANGYALYSAGSLVPHWLSLLLVPTVLGGSGSFSTATWLGPLNLPEAMGYVGLLPLVALFALLGTLVRRRRGERWPDWLIWVVMAVVGVVLALGSYTPLGHVLAHVPLFGGQRLQSRNIAITDLALAVLLAYWADQLLSAPATRAGVAAAATNGSRGALGWTEVPLARRLALVPLVGALVLALVAIADPGGLTGALGATAGQAAQAVSQVPVWWLAVGIIVLAGAVVLLAPRLAPVRRTVLVTAVVVVDLVAFGVTAVWLIDGGPVANRVVVGTTDNPTSAGPGGAQTPADLGRSGRFAIYDPGNSEAAALANLGTPDLNVLDGRFSVVGYSSIVDGIYARVLGSHAANGQGTNQLSPPAIANGELDQLSTTTLLALPNALVVPAPSASWPSPPQTGVGNRTLRPGATAGWFLGSPVRTAAVSLALRGADRLTVRLDLASGGTTTWAASASDGASTHLVLTLPSPVRAVSLEVTNDGGAAVGLGPPAVRSPDGAVLSVQGTLADAISPTSWSYGGLVGPFVRFDNHHAAPPVEARALESADPATATATAGPAVAPTSARVTSTAGAVVVRSVAMIPGWSASWTPSGGPARSLPVRRFDLVQAVRVPGGAGTLTWHYRAPGLLGGFVASVLGLLALLALVVVAARRRRPNPETVQVETVPTDNVLVAGVAPGPPRRPRGAPAGRRGDTT